MKIIISVIFIILLGPAVYPEEYTVGIGDILEVSILQPDHITNNVTVTPGGEISVPFLGTIQVKGKTITEVQRTIQYRLAQGYLKYPVVTVSLIESRSRNYTISGEVNTPGNYQLQENTTVLKAIAVAGGFTRFGSKSRVKILRPRKDRPGYREIKVDLKAVINGDAKADILIEPGDIIVISEGFF